MVDPPTKMKNFAVIPISGFQMSYRFDGLIESIGVVPEIIRGNISIQNV